MAAITQGRDRLQEALIALGRRRRTRAASARRQTEPPVQRPERVTVAPPTPVTAVVPGAPAPIPEPAPRDVPGLDALVERLERIEERLADLQRPVRPRPATREMFAEWVRLRRWEEISFGDFLRLRRAGSV